MSKYFPHFKLTNLTASQVGLGVISIAATSFCYVVYRKVLANTPPKKWRKVGEISELICYPVKSCAPLFLQQIQCNQLGMEEGYMRDRVFMVITTNNQYVSGRAQPRLVLIKPRFEEDDLILSAPNQQDITIDILSLYNKPKRREVIVLQQPVRVTDCGDEIAKWLTLFISNGEKEIGYRLVFHPQIRPTRKVPDGEEKYGLCQVDTGSLHDCTSYMVINESSVNDLNLKIDHVITPLQFRPNFVVRGAEPYDEDTWKWVKIGENTIFKNVRPCTRCIFTNVDPKTGLRQPQGEPVKILKKYRPNIENDGPIFGTHLGVRRQGVVSMGDSVYVQDDDL